MWKILSNAVLMKHSSFYLDCNEYTVRFPCSSPHSTDSSLGVLSWLSVTTAACIWCKQEGEVRAWRELEPWLFYSLPTATCHLDELRWPEVHNSSHKPREEQMRNCASGYICNICQAAVPSKCIILLHVHDLLKWKQYRCTWVTLHLSSLVLLRVSANWPTHNTTQTLLPVQEAACTEHHACFVWESHR